MSAILNSLNIHNFPIFQPILMKLVPKLMAYRALSYKTHLSLGLRSPLILVDICMKIHDSLKTFQVVELTRLRRNLVMVEVPWEITKEV